MGPPRPDLVLFALAFLLLQASNGETAKRGQKIKLKHGGNDIAKKVNCNGLIIINFAPTL
jgi:hypothetical protein